MEFSDIHARTLRVLNTNGTQYPKSTTFEDDLNDCLALRTMDILRLQGYKQITMTRSSINVVDPTGLSSGTEGFDGGYSFPTDLIDIIRVEVNKKIFTNGEDDWVSIDSGDFYDLRGSTVPEKNHLDQNYSTARPQITIYNGQFFIRPLPVYAVSSGVWIFYKPRQVDLSADDDEPTFEQNLHQILIYDCAELEILAHPESYSEDKRNLISIKREEVEKKFIAHYQTAFQIDSQVKAKRESFK